MSQVKIADLLGKVFVQVEASPNMETLRFLAADGTGFEFHHDQDCCEHVRIESIVGDLALLEGAPLLMADESSSEERPANVPLTESELKYGRDSETWTFYKFGTIKGYVDVRWLGESNGYYSESVKLRRIS